MLATPLTVCLVVMGRHVDRLGFLEILFGDEPALEADERLYQRVLAGDDMEAIEVAEQSLKKMPLLSYYDDVAVEALGMAYADFTAGRLKSEDMSEIRDTIEDVVEGLADHAKPASEDEPSGGKPSPSKAEPLTAQIHENAGWSERNAILCVPARTALDEGPLFMLSQLLANQGLGSTVTPYGDISKLKSINFSSQNASIVVLSYLGSQNVPAYMRILVRRLRALMPDATIIAGFWLLPDDDKKAETWRAAVGADRAATKIADALAMCAEIAAGAIPAAKETQRPAEVVLPKAG
jgi:hypothetical protein